MSQVRTCTYIEKIRDDQCPRKNGYEKEDLFLVDYKGYILGSGTNYNKFIIVNKEKTTSSQKKTALTYIEEGYHPYFTDEEIVKHKF